jgi:hypothetical protein
MTKDMTCSILFRKLENFDLISLCICISGFFVSYTLLRSISIKLATFVACRFCSSCVSSVCIESGRNTVYVFRSACHTVKVVEAPCSWVRDCTIRSYTFTYIYHP